MPNLYIVATPIGNLQDITLRAIDTLKSVDVIVCEDTRVTSNLLKKFDIKKQMIAVNEFNEEQVVYQILQRLETENVALVSDAGTPHISDPGFRLVNTARHSRGTADCPTDRPRSPRQPQVKCRNRQDRQLEPRQQATFRAQCAAGSRQE